MGGLEDGGCEILARRQWQDRQYAKQDGDPLRRQVFEASHSAHKFAPVRFIAIYHGKRFILNYSDCRLVE